MAGHHKAKRIWCQLITCNLHAQQKGSAAEVHSLFCHCLQALGLDWRHGALLFESLLVDHDYAVNYVNWNYFAGVGNDPRNRVFQTVRQGMKYDPQAHLIKAWIPPLQDCSAEHAHRPWTASQHEQRTIRELYPQPLIDPRSQE